MRPSLAAEEGQPGKVRIGHVEVTVSAAGPNAEGVLLVGLEMKYAAVETDEEARVNVMRTNRSAVHIRWGIRRDLADLLRIEEESFEFPWNEEEFLKTLRRRNVVPMAAEWNGRIASFVIYQLCGPQFVLLNLAVEPQSRRQGLGRQMIEMLKKKLSTQRRTRITVEVRETNLDALCFFRACGFRAVKLLRGAYDDTPEDAIRLVFSSVRSAASRNGAQRKGIAMTRCKFKCSGVTKRLNTYPKDAPFAYDAEFHVVGGDTEENKRFFASTPSGQINVKSLREDTFVPGAEYYVDFTPAKE